MYLTILSALLLGQPGETPLVASRLAVIQEAPSFALTTQEGALLRLSDLKGKVLLVSFIFTTCSGSCPATTHRMAQVQEELKKRDLASRIHLLSITLDPARDTPEVLRNYMRLYDANPANWTLLTGSADTIAQTIAAWDMWVKRAANGQLDHPSRVFLVDPRGQIREIYNLDYLKAPWVADDVQGLLKEEN